MKGEWVWYVLNESLIILLKVRKPVVLKGTLLVDSEASLHALPSSNLICMLERMR